MRASIVVDRKNKTRRNNEKHPSEVKTVLDVTSRLEAYILELEQSRTA